MPYRIPIAIVAFLALITFTIINPNAGLDLVALLLIAFAAAYKIFGDYALLTLLAIRPTLDYGRDWVVFQTENFSINLNAAVAIILFLWAIYFFYTERQYAKNIPLKTPILIFLGWCALSIIWSFDKSATITETIKLTNLFALFGAFFVLRQKIGAKFSIRLLKVMLAAAIIPLCLAIYQFITQTGMNIDGITNRIYGTFAHPNILATFALLLIIVITENIIQWKNNILHFTSNISQKTQDYLLITLYSLFLLILLFTYTRIAWLGLALFLFIIGLVYFRKLLLGAIAAIMLFYIVFYPINTWLKNNFGYNLESYSLIARLTSRNEEADSIRWRADVANKVIPLWRERLVLGYGYGAFPKVWDDNKGMPNIWDNTSEAHNDYLKIGFETGVVGLILYLTFFVGLLYHTIKKSWKKDWTQIVFIASILVFLGMRASDNMLHHTPAIWWLFAWWGVWRAE